MAPVVVEIVAGQLYYEPCSRPASRMDTTKTVYLNVEDEFVYTNYFDDFGPLHLGHTFQFCDMLSDALTAAKKAKQQLHVVSSIDIHHQTNMVCLLCCWAVLCNGQTPRRAIAPFEQLKLAPFHDATDEPCEFDLSVVDVVQGFYHSVTQAKYISRATFSATDYTYYEKVENGDLNWISPKFIAFAGPQDIPTPGATTHPPAFFVPYFLAHHVTLVIRLNDKLYDESPFVNAGISHVDLVFPDGATPTDAIIAQFLAACEATPGAVAVHCKAGLGRTGTCIACYMMKHDNFTANQAIGWLRLCRPGSVIGEQQDYLVAKQAAIRRAVVATTSPSSISRTKPRVTTRVATTATRKTATDRRAQGDRLLAAKRKHFDDAVHIAVKR
ncbi:unnamed protein product [Aphanomyces euteiches]